jgi:hypothetical protein
MLKIPGTETVYVDLSVPKQWIVAFFCAHFNES